MHGINKDPFACKLACHLVKAQFGDICEVIVGLINPVCDRLLLTAQTIPVSRRLHAAACSTEEC